MQDQGSGIHKNSDASNRRESTAERPGCRRRDRHGNQRPFGMGIDIGADQFTPSQP